MPEHFFEKSEDGTEAPMAKVWREFHSHEERHRWRWLKSIGNHQTGGIPTIVFLLLIGAAGALMLSHFFGRPWF